MRIACRQQMIEIDRRSIEEFGIPGFSLMQEAGLGAAAVLKSRLASGARVVVCAGGGNNGGDGLVLAKDLLDAKIAVEVFLLAAPERFSGDARLAYQAWRAAGGNEISHDTPSFDHLKNGDWIVDAIYGTGFAFKKEIPPGIKIVEALNRLKACGVKILALDLPSGIDADSGVPVYGESFAIEADLTVAFGLPKLGCLGDPGCRFTGELVNVPLPFAPQAIQNANPPHFFLESRDVQLPPRPAASHKGDFGHAVIIAGSSRMPGAARLAVSGALRGGAGKVTGIVPTQKLIPTFAAENAEAMWLGAGAANGSFSKISVKKILNFIDDLGAQKFSVAIGPGIGTGPACVQILKALLARYRKRRFPLVIDADALRIFAKLNVKNLLPAFDSNQAPIVLTPHPGELGLLLGTSAKRVQANRHAAITKALQKFPAWIVLKGFRTLIGSSAGKFLDINSTGNPGMARGGMGDVLTGILAARLAGQADSPRQAIDTAVYVHGLAGDLASNELGEEVLLPRDLLHALPRAFKQIAAK